MNSPTKRSTAVVPKPVSNGASEFPPIRSRSPKKKTSGDITTTKATQERLPRVTFATGQATQPTTLPDDGEELEVLKCILVREGYLQRLATASTQGKVSGSHLSATIDVLDLLRVSTIEVIEAIATWRRKKERREKHNHDGAHTPLVFNWNSINYLLKLPSDLDFLDKHQGLTQWLGFTLVRNPFVLPVNLDMYKQLEGPSSLFGPRLTRENGSSSQFVQVGGKRVPANPSITADAAAQYRAAALAERKRPKNPYETRVLNDEELVPRALIPRTPATLSRPGTGAAEAHVLPSQIGDLDMARIHACEALILQEEAMTGRYTRDAFGHVVPESEAQRCASMVTLSGDAYQQQTRVSREEDAAAKESNPLPPKAHAKKRTGMLGPISKPHPRPAVQKAPQLDRSRGAQLEDALRREAETVVNLGVQLDAVREEIERKLMDLAYYDSFPGAQLFGDELLALRKQIYADVALLRRDLIEKQLVLNAKTASLYRKREIVHTFKANHQTSVDRERAERLKNPASDNVVRDQDTAVRPVEHPQDSTHPESVYAETEITSTQGVSDLVTPTLTPLLVHDMCATLIQKITRGKLARAAFEVMKIEFYVGSKYMQAVVRGFIARRRVAKMYWQLTASLIIQCAVRGMLARRLVAQKQFQRERQRAALRIQRVFRGLLGRQRMRRVRRLDQGRTCILAAAESIAPGDLVELADACEAMARRSKSLPSVALGLIRIVMVWTNDSDTDVAVGKVRWSEAAGFLRCTTRLQRRVHLLASVAATAQKFLRESPLAAGLLAMYREDKAFIEPTFAALASGWRAAVTLFRFVDGIAAVSQEQHVFQYDTSPRSKGVFYFAQALDDGAKRMEIIELNEHQVKSIAVARRFVPEHLINSAPKRPRAQLVVVDQAVPVPARTTVIEQLQRAIPGRFVVLNHRELQGKSSNCILTQQREILGAESAAVLSAMAMGHSVVLECDIGLTDAPQRKFLTTFTALKAALHPTPQCILLHASLRNHTSTVPDNTATIANREIKSAFEHSADALLRLKTDAIADEMMQASRVTPSASLVLMMEAAVVLLTPSKRFEPPPAAPPSGLSWPLAKRLLSDHRFFVSRLQRVAHDAVTIDNLCVLKAYITHTNWPQGSLQHSSSLLLSLADFIESVTTTVELAYDAHGLAPTITRSSPVPGLFDSVIVYSNEESSEEGVVHAFDEILDAALVDARVFRDVIVLDSRRCLLTVSHDDTSHRVFFRAYDPITCFCWRTAIEEHEIDALLAPNSVERGEDATILRRPPATRREMYHRLALLCLLQMAKKTKNEPIDLSSPATRELLVHPPAIRLWRRVLRVNGHHATVTIAELTRGRLQVDVTVHGSAQALRQVVTVESILPRLSHHQATEVFIPPDRLPGMVLERLHVFRRTPCTSSSTTAPLEFVVRRNETSPGRVLLRKAVRSRWLPSSQLWLLTVRQRHASDSFQLDVYQPQSCERFSRVLSAREFQDLRMLELCQAPASATAPDLLNRLLQLLQFETDDDTSESEPPSITGCRLRHHILARFPLVIRHLSQPHHVVDRGGVLRTYVQVETQVDHKTNTESIRIRVFMPDGCEEQHLHLQDADVDAAFVTLPQSWTCVHHVNRQRMVHTLAQQALRWDPYRLRVIALLASGEVVSIPFSRGISRPPVSTKRDMSSLYSARSSAGLLPPTPSSCIRLLDQNDDDEADDEGKAPFSSRFVYAYDKEEPVLHGSFRANGVLLAVQVSMKAVLVSVRVARVPVDRIIERDSFELAFVFYHPPSSSSQSLVIQGHTQLREVVGPLRAILIASSTVPELLRHIIETRTSVTFPKASLNVEFITDRLYAKTKATPINANQDEDAVRNAAKLIDRKPERGVKLLSKTKTLSDRTRVVFTVFDVRTVDEAACNTPLRLRVDACVAVTSTRLSLAVELTDLVYLLVDVDPQDTLAVATTLVDHVGLERKRDGSPDRLYIVETSAEAAQTVENQEKRLLGKTVRRVRGSVILVKMFAVNATICLQFYEPQSSAQTDLSVDADTLALVLGFPKADLGHMVDEGVSSPSTVTALLHYLLTFVHIDTNDQGIRVDLRVDDGVREKMHKVRDQVVQSIGRDIKAGQRWRLTTSASAGHELCCLYIHLPAEATVLAPDSRSMSVVAWVPSRDLVVSQSINIPASLVDTTVDGCVHVHVENDPGAEAKQAHRLAITIQTLG